MTLNQRFVYPRARIDDVIADYHGTKVADPYRWLEDPEAPDTQAWVVAQNRLTAEFMSTIPARAEIKARLTKLWDYAKFSVPRREGGRYFFSKNDGLQNQAVLYVQADVTSPDGEPRVLLDPNKLSEDGTIALTNQAYSRDGRLLAYGLSQSGSDWQEIRIRQIDSGRDYDEVIQWCKFTGVGWKHDNSGFYYSRYPEPGAMPDEPPSTQHRVYWHSLGTLQADDVLVYARPDARELAFDPIVTEDGEYLVLHVWHGTDVKNRIYYRRLDEAAAGAAGNVASDNGFVRLLDDADARYDFIDNVGSLFYFHTDLDAPRGRVIAIDVNKPDRENWREVISEQEDAIDLVAMVNNTLVVTTLHDAYHRLILYDLDGQRVGEITLPVMGTIFELSGKREERELFINFNSHLYPPTIFRYDFHSGELAPLWQPELTFDPAGYETKQVFYAAEDGLRVPMFITHKKGTQLDGRNPTILYGYGGFAVNQTPLFGVSRLVWLENGGIFAQAVLRGGGEYGEAWHQAGKLDKKQNVFNDFIAAAEWLIANGYASSDCLAIQGGSNGGLLVAASMLQRPELFGAVVCQVPVIDMLRYHKFTAGRYWIPEYGNAEADPEHFKFLYAYSPLHNVRQGASYPPILIVTADTDDRVVPLHANKFAASLQAADPGENLILLRVETKAGHGLGKPTTKVIEELTDIYAFLFEIFGVVLAHYGNSREN